MVKAYSQVPAAAQITGEAERCTKWEEWLMLRMDVRSCQRNAGSCMAFAWMLHERTFDLRPLCHKSKATRLLYTLCQAVSCTPMTAEDVLHQTLEAVMDWTTCSYYVSCPGSSWRGRVVLFELPHRCSNDKWCLVRSPQVF